jgi:hypothetical protein
MTEELKPKKNVRQQELELRLKNMIVSLLELWSQNGKDWNMEHSKEEFLAKFRLRFSVGYASVRYFKDFVTVGYIEETSEGKFKISEKIKNNVFGIHSFEESEEKQ